MLENGFCRIRPDSGTHFGDLMWFYESCQDLDLFCDVFFYCKRNVRIAAHQSVLARYSPTFLATFFRRTCCGDNAPVTFIMPDMDPEHLKTVLTLLYTGVSNVKVIPGFEDAVRTLKINIPAEGISVEPTDVSPGTLVRPPNEKPPFACGFCDKEFARKDLRERHEQTHLLMMEEDEDPEEDVTDEEFDSSDSDVVEMHPNGSEEDDDILIEHQPFQLNRSHPQPHQRSQPRSNSLLGQALRNASFNPQRDRQRIMGKSWPLNPPPLTKKPVDRPLQLPPSLSITRAVESGPQIPFKTQNPSMQFQRKRERKESLEAPRRKMPVATGKKFSLARHVSPDVVDIVTISKPKQLSSSPPDGMSATSTPKPPTKKNLRKNPFVLPSPVKAVSKGDPEIRVQEVKVPTKKSADVQNRVSSPAVKRKPYEIIEETGQKTSVDPKDRSAAKRKPSEIIKETEKKPFVEPTKGKPFGVIEPMDRPAGKGKPYEIIEEQKTPKTVIKTENPVEKHEPLIVEAQEKSTGIEKTNEKMIPMPEEVPLIKEEPLVEEVPEGKPVTSGRKRKKSMKEVAPVETSRRSRSRRSTTRVRYDLMDDPDGEEDLEEEIEEKIEESEEPPAKLKAKKKRGKAETENTLPEEKSVKKHMDDPKDGEGSQEKVENEPEVFETEKHEPPVKSKAKRKKSGTKVTEESATDHVDEEDSKENATDGTEAHEPEEDISEEEKPLKKSRAKRKRGKSEPTVPKRGTKIVKEQNANETTDGIDPDEKDSPSTKLARRVKGLQAHALKDLNDKEMLKKIADNQCFLCDTKYMQLFKLREHLILHHLKDDILEKFSITSAECPYCQFRPSNRQDFGLARHLGCSHFGLKVFFSPAVGNALIPNKSHKYEDVSLLFNETDTEAEASAIPTENKEKSEVQEMDESNTPNGEKATGQDMENSNASECEEASAQDMEGSLEKEFVHDVELPFAQDTEETDEGESMEEPEVPEESEASEELEAKAEETEKSAAEEQKTTTEQSITPEEPVGVETPHPDPPHPNQPQNNDEDESMSQEGAQPEEKISLENIEIPDEISSKEMGAIGALLDLAEKQAMAVDNSEEGDLSMEHPEDSYSGSGYVEDEFVEDFEEAVQAKEVHVPMDLEEAIKPRAINVPVEVKAQPPPNDMTPSPEDKRESHEDHEDPDQERSPVSGPPSFEDFEAEVAPQMIRTNSVPRRQHTSYPDLEDDLPAHSIGVPSTPVVKMTDEMADKMADKMVSTPATPPESPPTPATPSERKKPKTPRTRKTPPASKSPLQDVKDGKCFKCEKSFPGALSDHIAHKHVVTELVAAHPNIFPKGAKRGWNCDLCEHHTKTKRDMVIHVGVNHQKMKELLPQDVGEFLFP